MTSAALASTISVQLVGKWGGSAKKFPVLGNRFLIGRDESCDLRPKNQLVSRHHAEICIDFDEATIHDLNSRNGTLVNGEPVKPATTLNDGDVIQIGPLEFTVSIRPADSGSLHDTPSDDQVANWLIAESDNRSPDVTHAKL